MRGQMFKNGLGAALQVHPSDAVANLEIYHLRCPKDVQFANVDDV